MGPERLARATAAAAAYVGEPCVVLSMADLALWDRVAQAVLA